MAFTLQTLSRVSTSMNSETQIDYSTGIISDASAPASYIYKTADSLSTVLGANYFLTATGHLATLFQPGDSIVVFADGENANKAELVVDSVNVGTPTVAASITFLVSPGVGASFSITSAEFLAAGAGGAVLVPAVAGRVIMVVSFTALLVFNTTAYNAITLTPSVGGVAVTSVIANTFAQATASFLAQPTIAAVAVAEATVLNQPLLLVPSAAPTTGNSPLFFNIIYTVV